MSMISEQIEDLQHLRFILSQVRSKFAEKEFKVVSEAIDTIQELSAKLSAANMERSSMYYNGGWIPCEERLPEEYGDYLVSWHDIVSNKNYYEIIECDPDEEDPWIGNIPYAGKHGYIILAWMPLPEPYQPKGGEDYEQYQDNC